MNQRHLWALALVFGLAIGWGFLARSYATSLMALAILWVPYIVLRIWMIFTDLPDPWKFTARGLFAKMPEHVDRRELPVPATGVAGVENGLVLDFANELIRKIKNTGNEANVVLFAKERLADISNQVKRRYPLTIDADVDALTSEGAVGVMIGVATSIMLMMSESVVLPAGSMASSGMDAKFAATAPFVIAGLLSGLCGVIGKVSFRRLIAGYRQEDQNQIDWLKENVTRLLGRLRIQDHMVVNVGQLTTVQNELIDQINVLKVVAEALAVATTANVDVQKHIVTKLAPAVDKVLENMQRLGNLRFEVAMGTVTVKASEPLPPTP